MRMKTRTLAYLAVLSALGTVFAYLSFVLPTGQLGFLALASLCGVAAVIESGAGGGIAVFIVTAVLSFLILPTKTGAIVYAVFFGWYPVMKLFAERTRPKLVEWAIKLISFNAAVTVLIFVFNVVFFTFDAAVPVIYLILNAVFIVFDIGVTRAIGFYISRIAPHMKRGK